MQSATYSNLPNCLYKFRRARGLSQKEVAAILGIKSADIISRWENSSCAPKQIIVVLKLSVLYRTSIEALFFDQYCVIKNEVKSKEEQVLKAKENSSQNKETS